MRFDLHVHTTASDGMFTPAELVALAAELGLAAVAVTDHDSVEGVPEALSAAKSLGSVCVIPGVELSAVHGGRDVHVLGYFIDHESMKLRMHLADLRAARRRRAEAIVGALRAAGYVIDLDEVLALSDGGAVGRSHVARALVERGQADDVSDAFRRLLGRGRPFYFPKDVRTPLEVLRMVLVAGGIPVLAHPGVTGIDDLVPTLAAEGLVGIEAYHPEHDEAQQARYVTMADEMGLLATGGPDYHGPSAPNPPLGSIDMPDTVLERLYEVAR